MNLVTATTTETKKHSTCNVKITDHCELNFEFSIFNQIKPSKLYSITMGLAEKIINPNCFDRLHDVCVTLLRFIYLYRKRFDEMYVY